jgi:hypothetical protein
MELNDAFLFASHHDCLLSQFTDKLLHLNKGKISILKNEAPQLEQELLFLHSQKKAAR